MSKRKADDIPDDLVEGVQALDPMCDDGIGTLAETSSTQFENDAPPVDPPERTLKPWCDFQPLNDFLEEHGPSPLVSVRLTQVSQMLSMLGSLAVLNKQCFYLLCVHFWNNS